MQNRIKWFEISTNDIERAKDFYAKVFNLEYQFIDMGESKMYMFGGPGLPGSAGCLVQSAENTPSTDGTIIYFDCEDCGVEASRIADAGGTLIVPKTDIGEFGFFAQFIDTEGNRIGIHSEK